MGQFSIKELLVEKLSEFHKLYQHQRLTVCNMNAENRWIDLVDKFKYSLRWVCCKIQCIDGCFLATKLTVTPENEKNNNTKF